eukprot:snap_masked-scaffold_6-processed-gene-17.10-mRNA-1 protein AED:0.41 eAED:1.00 QI:0/-1/0/1/-1/1/1/0/175
MNKILKRFLHYPTKEVTKVPRVTFQSLQDGKLVPIDSATLFKNKTVLFALPGAFTPTCSSTHLPGYEAKAQELKDLGIENIYCLSVNDAFVMSAWKKDLEVKNVELLADGNAEFTKGVGMVSDKSGIGFGDRSWRYSMVLNGDEVEKVFAEPVKEGDPFEVSDVETMLTYLKSKK